MVESRLVSSLTPYAKNARTHSKAQIEQIAKSIGEFGFTNPVLIDAQGGVIAGHGRVAAAEQLGMAEVPCIVLHGLTEAQRRAYVLADNRIALNSGWNEDLLRVELSELRVEGFDLDLTGFDVGELSALFEDPEVGGSGGGAKPGAGSLMERFGIAPFTVLNAREGWWQDRKRAWIALGIQSELGRGAGEPGNAGADASGAYL